MFRLASGNGLVVFRKTNNSKHTRKHILQIPKLYKMRKLINLGFRLNLKTDKYYFDRKRLNHIVRRQASAPPKNLLNHYNQERKVSETIEPSAPLKELLNFYDHSYKQERKESDKTIEPSAPPQELLEFYEQRNDEEMMERSAPVFHEEEDEKYHVGCCICDELILENQEQIIAKCKHKFHRPCIAKWLCEQNTCPLCRNAIL
jgi:hypothetical protein